jgi:uncharacterized membrane protein
MNLPNELIAAGWLWVAHLVFWPVLALAALRAPWHHLRESESLHVLLGVSVTVLVLWSVSARTAEGVSFHLLGATLLTLMFGREFAVLCLTAVLAAATLNGDGGWLGLPLNALLTVLAPVGVSSACHTLVCQVLPPNFFVYIFGSAFFSAALAMLAAGALSAAVTAVAASAAAPAGGYFPFFVLLAFPEAFVTGMLMTVFVVYRPQWVSSFSDERYLKGR